MQASTTYSAVAKELVWQLKLAGAQAAAQVMARHMARGTDICKETVIIPVPTATSRSRQRGYDQAKLLARELSRQHHLPYRDCLVRTGQTHQHGLSREQRLSQLISAFRVVRPHTIRGSQVILIDDVMTTGATLEAAATALQAAGAKRIEGLVFAQP